MSQARGSGARHWRARGRASASRCWSVLALMMVFSPITMSVDWMRVVGVCWEWMCGWLLPVGCWLQTFGTPQDRRDSILCIRHTITTRTPASWCAMLRLFSSLCTLHCVAVAVCSFSTYCVTMCCSLSSMSLCSGVRRRSQVYLQVTGQLVPAGCYYFCWN